MKDGDEILTGLLLNEDTNLMTNRQLNEFSLNLKNNNYRKILGDSYKLMVFDVEIISNLDDEIEIENQIFTREQLVTTLKSGNNNEKAALFSVILADEILSSRNPLFFFSEFKKGNIIIYPETALFKSVKIIPVSFIKDIGKKIFEKTRKRHRV